MGWRWSQDDKGYGTVVIYSLCELLPLRGRMGPFEAIDLLNNLIHWSFSGGERKYMQ